MRPWSYHTAAWLLGLALATPTFAMKFIWSAQELRDDLAQRLTAEELALVPIPFEIDEEIRRFAAKAIEGIDNGSDQAEAIARAILRDKSLNAQYDESTTITAREVFRTGRANCISLANLFIGIARDRGMLAYYVDVTQATRVRKVSDLIVARGHICAGIRFPHGFTLFDFADRPERTYHKYSILDDQEALATFLLARNLNLALRESDPVRVDELLARARRDTDLALKIKPGFAKALVNLGTAHLRLGKREDALDRYRSALAIDSRLVAAHLAMGYVYAQDGNWKEARRAYEAARDNLPGDALVRYHLGVALYRDGDLGAARQNLERALQLDPELGEAWSGLGVTLRGLGLENEAREAFQRAGAMERESAEPREAPAPR